MFNKLRSIIFKLDPELAHNLAIKALKYNYIPNNKIPSNSLIETEIFGKKISNPIGLAAGFDKDAEVTDNIWGYLWGKLGYGALLFATALTNESIADVLADKKYQPMLKKLASELSELAAAQNIKLQGFNGYDPYAFLKGAANEKATNSFDEMVAHNRKSAKSHSGIWRDLAVRKRKTEADPQLTLPVSLGEELGHPMPITRLLISLINEIEIGERPLDYGNLEELNILFKEIENAS